LRELARDRAVIDLLHFVIPARIIVAPAAQDADRARRRFTAGAAGKYRTRKNAFRRSNRLPGRGD
jgi:hypothetical protein